MITPKQKYARQRNWAIRCIKGSMANLRQHTHLFNKEEILIVRDIQEKYKELLDNWDDNYEKIKQQNLNKIV